MKLKESLYYTKRLMIGTALGKVKPLSQPMNYSSNLELIMKCKMFSEGNLLLEEVLYRLNEIGLNTYACCKGHKNNVGYIAFIMNEQNKELVSKMCSYLLEQTNAAIAIGPHHYNVEGISVSVYFSSKDRKQILDSILNPTLYQVNEMNKIVDEIIEISEIQNNIHSDMTFGLFIKKEKEGYRISTDSIFMMHSLKRNVSVSSLEIISSYLGELSDEIDSKIVSPTYLLRRLQRTREKIGTIVSQDDNAFRDYYSMFTEEEVLKIMAMNEIVPGKLEHIMNKIGNEKITEEEEEYYSIFAQSEDIYFMSLKLEESLAYKRQSISLQEKKRMI